MLAIEKFIEENENWKELIQQAPYFLKIDEDEDYALIKYDMINSDFTQEIVNECRGIIIDKHTNKAHSLSFKKFFNIQEELHADIDWRTAKVQEKVDGSKILVFWNEYKNKWQVSTSGTLDAYKAQVNDSGITFGQLFEEAVKNSVLLTINNLFNKLDKGHCYTFELVSPESRIVVPYRKTEIYLIGVRDIYTFEEEKPTDDYLSEFIKIPKSYPLHTLEDCLKATEKMGFDEEGFVVVDDNWNRVKIKSPEYVLAHRTKSTLNYIELLHIYLERKHDDLLSIFPEYQYIFDKIAERYTKLETTITECFNKVLNNTYSTRKELANYIQTICSDNKYVSAVFFLYDHRDYTFKKWFLEQSKDKQKRLMEYKINERNNL